MADFAEIVPVKEILHRNGMTFKTQNFEDIYGQLVLDPDKAAIREALEKAVFGYFSSLRLFETPTIYDHLILGLRPKDVIATFNWDPF
jgi:hypothetical protein